MTTYNPGSLADILHRAGLEDDSIALFIAMHPKMALPKFQRGLRKMYANQTEFLLPPELIDNADWDLFDSDLLYDISRWFHSVDPGGNFFDWNTKFQTDDFAFFVAPAPAPLVGTPPLNPTNINPPEPTQYVHSYHNDILQADIKSLAQRSNTAATDILAPHPLWQSTAITGSINIDKKTFLTTDLPTLSSTKHSAIHDWYIKLCQQATSTQIDLCPLRYFKKGHALWPQNLPAPIVFEMGNLLLLKLQNKSTLDLTNEVLHLLYLEHITHSDSKLAGYYFLHALLTHAADSTSSVLAPLPHFSDSVDPIHFAAALISYCKEELSKNRTYSNRELSLHFLRELDAHSFPVQVQLKLLDDMTPEEIIPKSLLVTNLALVLAQNHPTFSKSLVPSAHQLRHKSSNPKQTLSSSTYTHQQGAAHLKTSLGNTSSTVSPHPFRQREELQCDACGTWGHSATRCSSLAKTSLLQLYIKDHPDHADRAATTWKNLHSSSHRRAVAHHLQQLHPDGCPPTIAITMDDIYEVDFL